jgi:hypothetical protein
MTLEALGAIALVLLFLMCFRNRQNYTIALLAVFLGVVIAGTHGPVHDGVNTAIHGIQKGANALVKTL